jgi:BolA protein
MTLAALIEEKVRAALGPCTLEIEDDSASHAGHGASGAHVKLRVVAEAFRGKSPVARHRLVYAALAEEMKGPIHALALTTDVPL